jgi:hypothetical protein
MRFHKNPPARSRKRVQNAFERNPIFEQVTRALLQGSGCAVSFTPEDATVLGVKWPQRMALDSLKRWLRENMPEAGFTVRKYRSNGSWVVSVMPPRQKRRKGENKVEPTVQVRSA